MAILELVIRQPIDKVCSDFRILPISIPDEITEPKLPPDWRTDESISKRIGDHILGNKNHLVIKVPSALLSNSYNYLINPLSPAVSRIKLLKPETILMDNRLLEALRK